ncbi:hypothetical protein, partial [Brevundimonas sp. P7753]|uniref:hypothetical protein n=1 Tax=Brevundimonas sp. P7753 TaxID=2726982 RepID=UPI001C4C4E60
RLERVLLVRTHLRGRHYGQRSCEPHQQVEHMAAPTRLSRTSNQSLPTESLPHMADTVEKVREPAVIGLFGSIWSRRGKLSD